MCLCSPSKRVRCPTVPRVSTCSLCSGSGVNTVWVGSRRHGGEQEVPCQAKCVGGQQAIVIEECAR